jgi:hypothetical protein
MRSALWYDQSSSASSTRRRFDGERSSVFMSLSL